VLLDELNLANQSVLEGLNAVLDHRAEVFIPELGATFRCAPGFRLFAAQNPVQEVCELLLSHVTTARRVNANLIVQRLLRRQCIFLVATLGGTASALMWFAWQGGGRKGLPKSFLNRFTRVHIDLLQTDDLLFIAGEPRCLRVAYLSASGCMCEHAAHVAVLRVHWASPLEQAYQPKWTLSNCVTARCLAERLYVMLSVLTVISGARCAGVLHPRLPAATLRRMIAFLAALHEGANVQRSFGTAGGPWEFNLRDLLRWCQLAEAAVPVAPSNTLQGEIEVCKLDQNLVLSAGLLPSSVNSNTIG